MLIVNVAEECSELVEYIARSLYEKAVRELSLFRLAACHHSRVVNQNCGSICSICNVVEVSIALYADVSCNRNVVASKACQGLASLITDSIDVILSVECDLVCEDRASRSVGILRLLITKVDVVKVELNRCVLSLNSSLQSLMSICELLERNFFLIAVLVLEYKVLALSVRNALDLLTVELCVDVQVETYLRVSSYIDTGNCLTAVLTARRICTSYSRCSCSCGSNSCCCVNCCSCLSSCCSLSGLSCCCSLSSSCSCCLSSCCSCSCLSCSSNCCS